MTKISNVFGGVISRILAFVRANPVRVSTWLAAVIVFVAAKFGILVGTQDVVAALVLAIPVLVGGEVAHQVIKK